MRSFLILATLLFFLPVFSSYAQEPNAVAITSDFMEKVEGLNWQVVDSRIYTPLLHTDFYFSMGSFSCDLNISLVNDSTVNVDSRLNSFDFTQRNYFNSRLVCIGAAIFFDSVLVREKSFYRVRIRIDSLVTQKVDCEHKFTGGDFAFDPSSDFDFYFIRNSLGDYRWNQIRDVMEQNYDYILERINFLEPTKVNFYISPCQLSDVGWDKRWDNALDLARNNLFVHFTHGINALHVQTVFMLRLMRLWGYAPALLVEGTASLVEFCDMFAQDYRRSKTLPGIGEMAISSDYRSYERDLSSYTAGSFVGYLIRTRNLTDFQNFYRRATDLTFAEVFRSVYGQDLAIVETEWHHYLDTLTLSPGVYSSYSHRAKTLMKYDRSIIFMEQQLALSADTLHLGSQLSNLYFYFGDYEHAENIYRGVAYHDSAMAIAKSYLANLLLAQGKLEEAESFYHQAIKGDTTDNYQPDLKLASIQQYWGNYEQAMSHLRQSLEKRSSIPIRIDIRIMMGDVFTELGQKDSARYYYQAALDTAKILLGSFSDRPLYHLRVARAALRLGEGKLALDKLQTEFFLEERMFYVGQILLAMGQAYDILGERDLAKEEYRKLFLYPTAWLDRQQAETYMKKPYLSE